MFYLFVCSKRLKESKQLDKFWKNAIAEVMPTRETRRRAFQSLGLGGLYNVMASSKGHSVAIRLAFEAHCMACDARGLGKFATFVSACMQLRSCDDWEVGISCLVPSCLVFMTHSYVVVNDADVVHIILYSQFCVFVCLLVCLIDCLFVCLFDCLFVCLIVCLFVCLFV